MVLTKYPSKAQRRKMAQLRFKGIVRAALANQFWLSDAAAQQMRISSKKNMILRREDQDVGILPPLDKAVLHKPYMFRTVPERQRLVHLIARLPIFSKIPPKVRARLSTALYYLRVEPGRTIIQQGNIAETLYFVVNGDIAVKTTKLNAAKTAYIEKLSYITGIGDWVGEVELLEECTRRHSFITITAVELFAVDFEQFNAILKPYMSKLWSEKKALINSLGYFSHFNYEQMISALHLSVIRQFNPLETIYHEDKGQASYVYFVGSGECMILQCLKMRVHQIGRNKTFELVDIEPDEEIFPNLSEAEIMRKLREESVIATKKSFESVLLSDEEAEKEALQKKLEQARKVDIEAIEIRCGLRKPKNTKQKSNISLLNGVKPSNVTLVATPSKPILHQSESRPFTTSGAALIEKLSKVSFAQPNYIDSSSEEQDADKHTDVIKESDNVSDELMNEELSDESNSSSLYSDYDIRSRLSVLSHMSLRLANENAKIESHFIDVGSMVNGGICGLGEKLEHRVIMARTTVQCLLLPRFWLLAKDQNPGNIWQRRRIHLDQTIPSRQSLYNDFLNTRNWEVFKYNIVNNVTSVWGGNPTKIQDIPVIGRIIEHDDIAE